MLTKTEIIKYFRDVTPLRERIKGSSLTVSDLKKLPEAKARDFYKRYTTQTKQHVDTSRGQQRSRKGRLPTLDYMKKEKLLVSTPLVIKKDIRLSAGDYYRLFGDRAIGDLCDIRGNEELKCLQLRANGVAYWASVTPKNKQKCKKKCKQTL